MTQTPDRIDLGALVITPHPDVDIQVQADQQTGAISQVTLAMKTAGVQVQPYAAPKSGGLWDDVRTQIRSSINTSGGLVEEVSGPMGTELHASMKSPNGQMQPVRFTAIEGDRWLLRAVFLGAASRPGPDSAALEDMVRSIEVVRGDVAMAAGNPIPMRLPEVVQPMEVPVEVPDPFERGPEITEIR
jgi:hypothetical protein